ncbi:hypothetical protein BDA99DRAFT_558495 [Phascolomyces articulosus]|uniref:Uncharacterized protein n=1 Tax=Phascolomyces articulosus TaxID=60185 RepID=A0AAD5PG30_9FUNG|nr:hypothetical protein BDA99DRAFT_558495 [Phascolomyces articulosus]
MEDLGITAIHHALQFPTDLESIRTHHALSNADTATVDRVLKRILNYLHGRNKRWPARRLFRCIDYIVQRCNHQAATNIFQLRSFRSCIKAALDRLAHDTATRTTTESMGIEEQQLLNDNHSLNNNNNNNNSMTTDSSDKTIHAQIIIKLIGDVLEHPSCNDDILMSIRQSQSMMYILQWASNSPKLESVCLHVLTEKGKIFAKDMIEFGAFWTLASLVGRIPDFLAMLRTTRSTSPSSSKRTTTTMATIDAPSSIKMLYLCLKASRIFENLMNYAKSSQANILCQEKAINFAHSVNFNAVIRSWAISASHYIEDPHNSTIRKLMHSLTSIISSCIVVSKDIAPQLADIQTVSTWRAILSYEMKAFLNYFRQQQRCQQINDSDNRQLNKIPINEIALRMQRVTRIALTIAVSCNTDGGNIYRQSNVDELTQDITIFLLLLFGLDVIVPEQMTAIGRPATSGLLDTYFGDCDFRQISGDKTLLFHKYPDLFIVLLECYIQHLQLASEWMVTNVSGYMAALLINVLGLLTNMNDDPLIQQQEQEVSPIQPRIQRLVSYFLHFDNAVQVFAAAPIYLNNVIWLPTIQNALQGLKHISNSDNNNKINMDIDSDSMQIDHYLTNNSIKPKTERREKHKNINLYKAKRAFAVLQTITRFPNVCAKLEQAGALHMANINFIPDNVELLNGSISKLNIYASFTHFIAALASSMALIRAKLREEFSIGPVIMKLLWQASHHLQEKMGATGATDKNSIQIKNAWIHVITGCLMVINAFEYDNESLQKWLSWPLIDDTHEEDDHQKNAWIQPQMTSIIQGRLSALPAVLHVLLSERSRSQESILQERINNNVQMRMLLQACNAFNLLSVMPECGIQLVRDTNAIQLLCELLKELLKYPKSTSDLVLEQPQVIDNHKVDTGGELASDQEFSEVEDEDQQLERINPEIQVSSGDFLEQQQHYSNKVITSSMTNRCFEVLHRGLVRILTSQENMRFIITSDVLTALFKPLRTSMLEMDNSKMELCRILCQGLSEERLEDFIRLFRFTSGDDNATRLHELCAVASVYACPNPSQWKSVLGIRMKVEGDEKIEIIYTKTVFGALCRMLMYDLLEQENDNVYEAPYRRPAAAQAIEILTQILTPAWVATREDMMIQLQSKMMQVINEQYYQEGKEEMRNGNEMVGFTTQYSNTPIMAKRSPLIRQSNFFAALLSGVYAESSGKTIQLLDITNHALKLFLDAVHGISFIDDDTMMRGYLSSSMQWCDVIDILLAADRFGNISVAMVCEEWVSRNLVNRQNKDRLNGAIMLYRRCRDPGTMDGGLSSDVWPFQNILKQALMVIVSELTNSCQTIEFNKMLQENDEHELSSFCQGLGALICSSIV